jgi:hypothetical protein
MFGFHGNTPRLSQTDHKPKKTNIGYFPGLFFSSSCNSSCRRKSGLYVLILAIYPLPVISNDISRVPAASHPSDNEEAVIGLDWSSPVPGERTASHRAVSERPVQAPPVLVCPALVSLVLQRRPARIQAAWHWLKYSAALCSYPSFSPFFLFPPIRSLV